MIRLGLPLGWDESYIDIENKPDAYIKQFQIPIIEECKLKFTDVLEELVMIAAINEEIKKFIRSKMQASISKNLFPGLNREESVNQITKNEMEKQLYDKEMKNAFKDRVIKEMGKEKEKVLQDYLKHSREIVEVVEEEEEKY